MGDMTERRWGRGDWGLYAATAALALGLALLTLQVWEADWAIPWSDFGDAIPVAAHFKTVLETGWYEHQPLLGAPFGQQYHDFPTAETTNFLMATVLGHLLGNWAVAMNAYFVLGFPLAALAAAWFLRVAGVSRLLTLPTAVLFAILPFHFVQGEPHLFVASYYVVPLGLVLALRTARGEPLWGWRRGTTHPVGRWFGRGAQTVVLAIVVGSTDTYFAVFTLIMLATAGIVAVVRDRSGPRFVGAAIAGVLIIAVMALNMLDDAVYGWQHGRNDGAFERMPEHAEYFAFKLAQLLLPWPGHRIPALADLREYYDTRFPLPSEQPALGFVAAVGFLILLGVLIHRVVTARRRAALGERGRTLGLLAVLALVAFLFGTVGGLGSVVALMTDVLRSWNRILVVIALLGLAAVALAIDAGLARWARAADPGRAVRRTVAGLLVAALVLIGVLDQTPGTNAHAATNARFLGYDDYFGRIEASLQPGDWVVQLPYQGFPEAQTATGTDVNDVLIPFLHTTAIGWTGGGLRGRPEADWTEVLQSFPAEEIPAIAAAAGASGLLLDRLATPEEQLDEWSDAFAAVLGAPLESEDERYWFWSLDAVPPARVAAVSRHALDSLLQGREWSP